MSPSSSSSFSPSSASSSSPPSLPTLPKNPSHPYRPRERVSGGVFVERVTKYCYANVSKNGEGGVKELRPSQKQTSFGSSALSKLSPKSSSNFSGRFCLFAPRFEKPFYQLFARTMTKTKSGLFRLTEDRLDIAECRVKMGETHTSLPFPPCLPWRNIFFLSTI